MLRSDRYAALSRLSALLVAVALVGGFGFGAIARESDDSLPGDNSVAAGFARDMSTHHAQAVEMAEIIRARTDSDKLRLLATDIALTQQSQIGRMSGWLDVWGLPRTGSGPSMAWMGMTDHGAMPGMADRAAIGLLLTDPVASAEVSFLELMIAHHKGGVAMAERAAALDIPDEVRRLADSIVRSQQSEIDYMQTMLATFERASA